MFPATLFLVLLIVTTPAMLVFDGPITHGVIVAAAAALISNRWPSNPARRIRLLVIRHSSDRI